MVIKETNGTSPVLALHIGGEVCFGMLERAKGCLEIGGRRLLRLPPKSTRNRRLHCAFWCHGASDIDLPSWWIALLQQPPPEKVKNTQSIADTARKCLSAGLGEGGFLDFLYPAKTLSLIHKLAIRDGLHARAQTQRQPAHHASRAYTKQASDSRLAVDSDKDHAMRLVSEIQKNSNQPSADTFEGLQESADAGVLELGMGVERKQNLKILRVGYNRVLYRYERLSEAVKNLDPNTQDTSTIDELFSLLTQLEEQGSRLLQMQCSWILEQLQGLEKDDWRIVDWDIALRATFLQADASNIKAMFQEALVHRKIPSVMPTALQFVLQRELWGMGIELYEAYTAHHMLIPKAPKFWSYSYGIDLRSLMGHARSLSSFAIEKVESIGPEVTPKLRHFAIALLEEVFHRKEDPSFGLQGFSQLFDALIALRRPSQPTIRHFQTAISFLLSQAGSRYHIEENARKAYEIYAKMREYADLIPTDGLLRSLLSRLCQIDRVEMAQTVFKDLKAIHGLPTIRDFEYMFHMLSRMAQADDFHRLLQDYIHSHGIPTRMDVYYNMLHLHSRRGELEKVIEIFNDMQPKYNITPDLTCWNAVISSHARLQDLEGAREWYEKMISIGWEPNTYSYLPFIKAYARRGDVQSVQALLGEHQAKNLPLQSVLIESVVYAHLQNEDFDAAQKLVYHALRIDFKGSRTSMWNMLLTAFAYRRSISDINQLRQAMQENNIPEDEMTYAALMMSLIRARKPEVASKILRKIMPKKGIRQTAFHYALLMGGFIRARQYYEVFRVYNSMLEADIVPDWSVKTTLVQSAANLDLTEHQRTSGPDFDLNLSRAEELLESVLATIDLSDIAIAPPLKGVRSQRLDEVYSSAYFEHLIFIYGSARMLEKVAVLYDRYIALASTLPKPPGDVSPPITMLAVLMASQRRANNHSEVQACWDLAVSKAKSLARRQESHISQQGWVLKNRRFLLADPLYEYLQSMAAQDRVDELEPLIRGLQRDGYALSGKCWNAYVRVLCPVHPLLAFIAAERELMPGWRRWPRVRRKSQQQAPPSSASASFSASSSSADSAHLDAWVGHSYKAQLARQLMWRKADAAGSPRPMPEYETLVYLAGAYMEIRRRFAFEGLGNERLEELARKAPKAVRAVLEMPRMDDEVQSRVLAGG